MKIPWKFKSLIFRLIDLFSAESLLYFLQRYVTRRSFKPTTNIINRKNDYHFKNWSKHKYTIKKYYKNGNLFEFGAGKDLIQNIFLSQHVSSQLIVDLNPMIDIELVNKGINTLVSSDLLKINDRVSSLDDLEKKYKIKYKAPFDASKTNLKDKEIDICISTNTLEHIPKDSLILILTEIKRILKDDGIVSAVIDYSDHYAHTDSSIHNLNYLNYDEKAWQKYNHNVHYQNRLRHYDYIDIFNGIGLKILEEEAVYDEKNIPDSLSNKFHNCPKSWSATSGYFVLSKNYQYKKS